MSVKVMSQNVMCWEIDPNALFVNRRPLIKQAVLESGADVVGFQEVRPNWTEWFKEDLAGFENYTVYRDEKKPEGTPVYWNPKRVTKLDCGHFWLSETPDQESLGWDAHCKRIACWVLFETVDSGEKFVFVNTHLDHRGAVAQKNGIRLICDFIKEKFSDLPLILTGDFNVRPDSETIAVANSLLTDARTSLGISEFEPTFHGYCDAGVVIDYIYHSNNLKCTDFQMLKTQEDGTILSDHYGIYAELEFLKDNA